jgi:hypothetical protein
MGSMNGVSNSGKQKEKERGVEWVVRQVNLTPDPSPKERGATAAR